MIVLLLILMIYTAIDQKRKENNYLEAAWIVNCNIIVIVPIKDFLSSWFVDLFFVYSFHLLYSKIHSNIKYIVCLLSARIKVIMRSFVCRGGCSFFRT